MRMLLERLISMLTQYLMCPALSCPISRTLSNIVSGNVSGVQVGDDPEAGVRVAAARLVQGRLV